MADDSTDTDPTGTATDTGQDDAPKPPSADDLGDAGRKALQEERRARRVAEKELETLRKAAMTDQEKAVASAKAEGLAEAAKTAGPRLVRAEFRAAAAGRVDKETLDAYLEDVDMGRFLGDDGEPDLKAIEARITRLSGGKTGVDLDGGARGGSAKPLDMNALIRQKAGMG